MEQATTLYVVVHENCIAIDLALYRDGKNPGLTDRQAYPGVLSEISRIKAEELFRVVTGDHTEAEYPLPPNVDTVKVCGAYGQQCVTEHMEALQKAHPNLTVTIHNQGTIFFEF